MWGGAPVREPARDRAVLSVGLLPLSKVAAGWLPALAVRLQNALGCRTSYLSDVVEPGFALLPARRQFSSSAILLQLRNAYFPADEPDSTDAAFEAAKAPPVHREPPGTPARYPSDIVLAVADVDLCVPIFTFVFGEAIDGGPCAIISGHRLRQEFYGLPPDAALLEQRLFKMATHEIGHTQGLRHCAAYSCVMATSYAIERVDLKSDTFCSSCSREFFRSRPAA